MNNATIDKLVNQDPNKISNPVLQAAVKELQDREKKAATERAIEQLGRVENVVGEAVSSLRNARKIEARAKAYLVAVGNARDQFHKDGDYNAFSAKVGEAARLQRGW